MKNELWTTRKMKNMKGTEIRNSQYRKKKNSIYKKIEKERNEICRTKSIRKRQKKNPDKRNKKMKVNKGM